MSGGDGEVMTLEISPFGDGGAQAAVDPAYFSGLLVQLLELWPTDMSYLKGKVELGSDLGA
jgi:hypothetical protein